MSRRVTQVGVKCPRGLVSHEECRKCALNPLRPCMFTPDLLELLRAENDVEPSDLVHSPSRLMDCNRKQTLMEHYPYYTDIRNAYAAMRGHMVHALFETASQTLGRPSYPGAPVVLRETRLETPIETRYGRVMLGETFGDWRDGEYDAATETFTGKPDLVVGTELDDWGVLHCKVVDYKSKNVIKHDLREAVREHQMQVNMYAWLVERALLENEQAQKQLRGALGVLPLEVQVDELEIVYLDMARVRRFTSAGFLKDRGKQLARKTDLYEMIELLPIDLLESERTEAFIKARVEARIEARRNLPPMLPPEEAWRCDYCPVRDKCLQYEHGGSAERRRMQAEMRLEVDIGRESASGSRL